MEKIKISDLKNKVSSLEIDYFLVSSSFEERCLFISKELKDLDFKKIIFYNSNELESIIDNSNVLVQLFKGNSQRVELNTDDPVLNYIHIYNIINQIVKDINSKPNILIDTTTFTHETLLVLIRLLNFHKLDLGKIYISYMGAKEYSVKEKLDEDKWLSKGIKDIRTVIGYPGFSDPTRENHLLILFGFESDRTKRLIDEFEFDNITLGFASIENSIQPNHQCINSERHKKLVSEYSADTFEFSLIDVDEVKNSILKYLTAEKYREMNTVIAPMNNKISTIGAGLAAIQNENIQITYARANIYNFAGYSIPNDDVYICELKI
ncbi:hypothetical protein [Flavobacterium macrobrachii]|uniref:Uncharacterized protein n=1 Tax=Flavobacterium macrobrachii TaxID=591204 RepID=A0ABS2CTR2_9FLAO|nr:hypothetical protein [Flavobacterium macrobrachii]MBM6498351.1 hypothetical protein [Flavobacterium macrobrachii]